MREWVGAVVRVDGGAGVVMAAQEMQRRRGRRALTEHRRERARVEIAVEAARLFLEKGVAATSADDIAEAVGLSRRTFWYYFATKEEAVAPLLVRSLSPVVEAFAGRPAGESLLEAFGQAAKIVGRSGDRDVEHSDSWHVVGIVRLTREEPGLRRVWLQVISDIETLMVGAVAGRLGVDPRGMAVRLQAAMITGAIRITAEEYAWHGDEYGANVHGILDEALYLVAEGFAPDSRKS